MGQTESAGSQQDTVSTGSLSEETQDQSTDPELQTRYGR